MSSTFITLAEAATTVSNALPASLPETVHAAVNTAVPAAAGDGGVLDTIKGLFTDGTAVAKIGINFLVLAIGAYAIARAKMAAATVVTVVAIGAVIMWWANTGLGSTSDKFDKDLGGYSRVDPNAPTQASSIHRGPVPALAHVLASATSASDLPSAPADALTRSA